MKKLALCSLAAALIVPALARAQRAGRVDASFDPGAGTDAPVMAIAQERDGHVLVGGSFSKVGTTARRGVARLNANGSVDTSFTPGAGGAGIGGAYPDLGVYALALQSDGELIVGGIFDTFDGAPHRNLVRLQRDGHIDTSFSAGTDKDEAVRAIAVQADGKILIGGTFKLVDGVARARLARLHADGSLDAGFSAALVNPVSVEGTALQADGKIVCVGSFHTPNSVNVARLGRDGSLDGGFKRQFIKDGAVAAVAIQRDGKIVIGGANFGIGTGSGRK